MPNYRSIEHCSTELTLMLKDIWLEVAQHIDPDPVVYARLSEVCRFFHTIFSSDRLWRCLDPYAEPEAVASRVHARLNALSTAEKSLYYKSWKYKEQIPVNGPLLKSLDLQLAQCLYHELSIYNRRVAQCAVSINPLLFPKCSLELQESLDVVTIALRRAPILFSQCHTKFRSDRNLVLMVVRQEGHLLHYATPELREDRQIVLAACASYDNKDGLFYPNWCPLACLSPEMLDDREVLRVAIERNPWAVQFFPEKYKLDADLIVPAIQKQPLAGRWLPPTVKYNRELLMNWLGSFDLISMQTILTSMPKYLRHDKAFMLQVLKEQGRAYCYLGDTLRSCRDLVLAAVSNWGLALQFARSEFADDREIVLKAVTSEGTALAFASKRLRKDPEVVEEAVASDGLALKYAIGLKESRPLVLRALEQNGMALQFVPGFSDDDELVAVAAKTEGSLKFASERLQQEHGWTAPPAVDLNLDFIQLV